MPLYPLDGGPWPPNIGFTGYRSNVVPRRPDDSARGKIKSVYESSHGNQKTSESDLNAFVGTEQPAFRIFMMIKVEAADRAAEASSSVVSAGGAHRYLIFRRRELVSADAVGAKGKVLSSHGIQTSTPPSHYENQLSELHKEGKNRSHCHNPNNRTRYEERFYKYAEHLNDLNDKQERVVKVNHDVMMNSKSHIASAQKE
ncbi:hypothetical protein VNO77_31677 [Canavalia gladiata]|uniref:Uncharacterized protein n=1 Tax=Canavalia gladiata TaxID=3824 RepID=A0AAN9KS24_CANGL